MANAESTKVKALKEARILLQTYGYNGFSFQHIADAIGIKKPSLYAHFESKEALVRSLINDYDHAFAAWTETVKIFSPKEKIGAFYELFFKFSANRSKLCPMTALIGDFHCLPKSVNQSVRKIYSRELKWLSTVIADGQKMKIFCHRPSSNKLAEIVISIGLGAQLVARVTDDPGRIQSAKQWALRLLEAT